MYNVYMYIISYIYIYILSLDVLRVDHLDGPDAERPRGPATGGYIYLYIYIGVCVYMYIHVYTCIGLFGPDAECPRVPASYALNTLPWNNKTGHRV